MKFRYYDIAILRDYGIAVLRCYDIPIFRYCGISILRYFVIPILRYFVIAMLIGIAQLAEHLVGDIDLGRAEDDAAVAGTV